MLLPVHHHRGSSVGGGRSEVEPSLPLHPRSGLHGLFKLRGHHLQRGLPLPPFAPLLIFAAKEEGGERTRHPKSDFRRILATLLLLLLLSIYRVIFFFALDRLAAEELYFFARPLLLNVAEIGSRVAQPFSFCCCRCGTGRYTFCTIQGNVVV